MSVPTRRRKNLKKAERREQVLDAALDCFGERGYHGTHVSHVIAAAGVARGTFYLHFDSKHAVFEALVERMLDVFLRLPQLPWQEVRTAKDAERLLREAYRRTFALFREHRRLTRLLFEEAVGIDKGVRRRLEAHYAAWRERIETMIDELSAAGVARRGLDREVTSELIVGMVERVARRTLLDDEEPDLDRLVDAVVSFELRGVLR